MKTSYHADLRARKRLGVSSIEGSFAKALEHGVYRKDIKGRFRKYLDYQARLHRHNCVVYQNAIYWFSKNETLVTVIPLHQKWHKYLKKESSNEQGSNPTPVSQRAI